MHGSCPQIRALLIGPLAAIGRPWLHIVALTAIGTVTPRTVSPLLIKFGKSLGLATTLRGVVMRIWVIDAAFFFSERTTSSTSMFFFDRCGVSPRQGYFCGDVRGVIDAFVCSTKNKFSTATERDIDPTVEIGSKRTSCSVYGSCLLLSKRTHVLYLVEPCALMIHHLIVPRAYLPKCVRGRCHTVPSGNRRYGTTWYTGP